VTGLVWAAGVIGYVVVAVLTARRFVRYDLERVARKELEIRRGVVRDRPDLSGDEGERWVLVQGSLITRRDREEAAVSGFMVGCGWPIAWLFAGIFALIALLAGTLSMGARKATEGIVPPSERDRLAAVAARQDRQELDFLRKQARELDLPFPGDDA
jgi:MFS family permease